MVASPTPQENVFEIRPVLMIVVLGMIFIFGMIIAFLQGKPAPSLPPLQENTFQNATITPSPTP